jgi:hypothetical protein
MRRGDASLEAAMLDNLIDSINRRLPPAPYPQRTSFIQIAPWLALLSAALGLILGGRLNLFIAAVGLLLQGVVPSLFFLLFGISPVLALVSIPGLNTRQRWGWILFALSVLIDFVLSLLRFEIFGLLFGALFLYYLLQTYTEYGRRNYR